MHYAVTLKTSPRSGLSSGALQRAFLRSGKNVATHAAPGDRNSHIADFPRRSTYIHYYERRRPHVSAISPVVRRPNCPSVQLQSGNISVFDCADETPLDAPRCNSNLSS
jgi:hypothetical protein